eukprot:TRINITY_DN22025_c0_g1_i1.p1 TRINITY_DN22025_c0_g1~~TRINITY_DN22025_c0_g1_i1.p1  ORF type:complete len:559 (-),score=27.04 TRINITY_DN22025_c0_g1_i1:131-1807(-)
MHVFSFVSLCAFIVSLLSVKTYRLRQEVDRGHLMQLESKTVDYTFPFMHNKTFCGRQDAFVSSFCFWVSDAKDAGLDYMWLRKGIGSVDSAIIQDHVGKCALLWKCSGDTFDGSAEASSRLTVRDISLSTPCKNDTMIRAACLDSFFASNASYKSRRERCLAIKQPLDDAKQNLREQVKTRKEDEQHLQSLHDDAHRKMDNMGSNFFSKAVSVTQFDAHSYLFREVFKDSETVSWKEGGESKKLTCTRPSSIPSTRRRRARRRLGSSFPSFASQCCFDGYSIEPDCISDCEEATSCMKALHAIELYENTRKELEPQIRELKSEEADLKSSIQGFIEDYKGNGCPELASKGVKHMHTCKVNSFQGSCEQACEKHAADHEQGCGVVQSVNPEDGFIWGASISLPSSKPFRSWLLEGKDSSPDVSPLYTQDVVRTGKIYVKNEGWFTFGTWYAACLMLVSSDHLRSSVLYQYKHPDGSSACDFTSRMSLHESFRFCDNTTNLTEWAGSGDYDKCFDMTGSFTYSKRSFCFNTSGERQAWSDDLTRARTNSSGAKLCAASSE